MANSKSARALSKPPPPPAIPLPPIPTQLPIPEVPPVSHNPPSPSKGQQTQQQPPPAPLQTPKRSVSLTTEIPKPDPMCLRSPVDTLDAVRAPLLSRTSRSIRRAFSARRAPTPATTRRPVTAGQIGAPVLHQGEKTMQTLARMGVTLDANGKGTIKPKMPPGSSRPKRPHERQHRKPVPNRDKSNGSSGSGGETREKKRDKRRGYVFEPALEDGTTVEPLETVIAPLRVLDNVLEEGEDGDGEVSPKSSCEASPGIFDDPVDKMRWSFLTPPKPQENVHGAPEGIGQMMGGIACSLADIQNSANLKHEAPKQGEPTPSSTDNPTRPVIDKKARQFTSQPSPPIRPPPPRLLPSMLDEGEETQARQRSVEETVKKFERKISMSPNPSPPVPRPLFTEGKNKSFKSSRLAPVKKAKRPIPPPLVFRKTGPSRPPGLPPIVIEQGNPDVDLPAPRMDSYADKENTAPKILKAQPNPQKSPIKPQKAPESPKGSLNSPLVPQRRQPLSPIIVSASPLSALHTTPVPLHPRTAQNDDIPARIKDPRTGIQYIPPAAPSPPISPQARPSQQEYEENCIEEAALKEILSLEASREDFSQYLATSSNGNNGKLLELYMAAKAHEEALNLVMELSENIQVIATQIPFFELDKSNYPNNIIMARKEVFKRMAEELPTYLMTSFAKPIERQRELEDKVEMEKQTEIEREVEREPERGRRERGEKRRRELQGGIERERGRARTEHLGRETARKPETTEEKKVIKDSEDREHQIQLKKGPERSLKLQEPKEKTRHPKRTSRRTTQSQISPVVEEESFQDISYPDYIGKVLITKDKGLASLIHGEKKALLDSLGTTTSPAQMAATKSHQKPPVSVRRRRSIVRVASGSERKVHMANSAQRKSLFPQQSHSSSRLSLHPSIERTPSLSSPASESEPEFSNDHWPKGPISDNIGGSRKEGGARSPANSSNRMSFTFTKDEIIRLSKVLDGEDHLKFVGKEECDSIVEKLLDLGEDEMDHKRDTTIGLYDLYDR